MTIDPIRIRIVPREPKVDAESSARDAFWRVIRDHDESHDLADEPIATAEGRLCRQFGRELREALVRELLQPLRTSDIEFFRNLDRRARSLGEDREWYEFAGALSHIVDERQRLIRESPSLRRAQERVAAAAGITFSTRIAGYSSLNLDVLPGSLKQLNAAFENDFDSFRVFLEAFVPVAFAEVFSESAADSLEFSILISPSTQRAFDASAVVPPTAAAVTPNSSSTQQPTPAEPAHSRARAEWLWRLANGSLLVPFILALVVMYFGLKALAETRAVQDSALKPILDHYQTLLEEDRRRLEQPPSIAKQGGPTKP